MLRVIERLMFWRKPAPVETKASRRYARRTCAGCRKLYAMAGQADSLIHHDELDCMTKRGIITHTLVIDGGGEQNPDHDQDGWAEQGIGRKS